MAFKKQIAIRAGVESKFAQLAWALHGNGSSVTITAGVNLRLESVYSRRGLLGWGKAGMWEGMIFEYVLSAAP